MKTIAQIAEETGVNVQTVYRRLNDVKHTTDESLTEKISGVTYFTEKGEQIIKECLTTVKQSLNTVKQSLNTVKQSENEITAILREQIKELKEELQREKEKNENLTNEILSISKQLLKLNENSQVLLREQSFKSLPPVVEKKSFWSKFKRKNNIDENLKD